MSDSTLPPFTRHATCPKCAGDYIGNEYRPTQPNLHWGPDGDLTEITTNAGAGPECLIRTCNTCNWAWLEQTADAQAAE